jgi:hypothetical protein
VLRKDTQTDALPECDRARADLRLHLSGARPHPARTGRRGGPATEVMIKKLARFGASLLAGVGAVGAAIVLCVVLFVVLYFVVVAVAMVKARLG